MFKSSPLNSVGSKFLNFMHAQDYNKCTRDLKCDKKMGEFREVYPEVKTMNTWAVLLR